MVYLLLVVVAIMIAIDAVAMIQARRYRDIAFDADTPSNNDFEVLVPIYGNIKYLENVDYLSAYGSKVILCTTSGESDAFYAAMHALAERYGFRTFRSAYAPPASNKRRTGGTVRDRIIRDVLNKDVAAEYVVCIDADTTTPLPLSQLIGRLHASQADLASINLVPQRQGSWLVQLQRHEYRQAMRLRFVVPWLVSGACHAGRAEALRAVMQRHSLFFQGNDVETGLLAEQLGYKVIHIPFEVNTAVPATFRPWWRQRLAWGGGEFRLFIVNIRYGLSHPLFWLYGAFFAIALGLVRWYSLLRPSWVLLAVIVLYCAMIYWAHWHTRNRWLLLMPLYTLFNSVVMTVLGIVWYFVMALPEHNFGIIRPNRSVHVGG